MKKSIIGKVSIICTVLCLSFSCERESEIVFSQTGVPVDLGLSVKWASCNVGANSPEDYGDYFAWGEVIPKKRYSAANNSYKYNPKILPPHADAATVNWGGAWRMPTDVEMVELRNNCTWTWITYNGVNGYKVTSRSNGNSIFLPAAGYLHGSSLYDAGHSGDYWSSSLYTVDPGGAYELDCFSGYVDRDIANRCYGQSVRPVLGEIVLETTILTVTTTIPTQITETTAVVGGYVTSDGGATVTERGVVYGKSPNPTISNLSNTIRPCGSGMGEFTYNMTDLQPITTYYVRAYATNDVGTAYGEEVSFTTNGTENGYAYVDLGLSVKWATCNVGANNPEDYGDYFAWGETTTKDTYSWSTYKYCNGDYDLLTKYCNKSSYGNNGFTDNKTQLELSDDAARANWGGSWRMPTDDELTELWEQCTWTWTTQKGVDGYRVTSKANCNSIFLPDAGWRDDTSLYSARSGLYWSSSLNTVNPSSAWRVGFYSDDVGMSHYYRYYGLPVRPVCP